MPTEKDAAEAERIIGDYYNERNMPKTAKVHYELADSFDPPKLEWATGTFAVVTYDSGDAVSYLRWNGTYWTHANGIAAAVEHTAQVEPLRVLADDEVAVPVVTKAVGAIRDDALFIDEQKGFAGPGTAVLNAYADALEAEEATR
jgi:hypothetical protein